MMKCYSVKRWAFYDHVQSNYSSSTWVVARPDFSRRTKTQYVGTKKPENPENADNTPKRLARRRAAFELQCFRNCTLSSFKCSVQPRLSVRQQLMLHTASRQTDTRPGNKVDCVVSSGSDQRRTQRCLAERVRRAPFLCSALLYFARRKLQSSMCH